MGHQEQTVKQDDKSDKKVCKWNAKKMASLLFAESKGISLVRKRVP